MADNISESQNDQLLDQLSAVLHSLTDRQLARLGVTLERQDDNWLWLRDAIVQALHSEGRTRAAQRLAEHDLTFSAYSMGISASFLRRLAPILAQRYEADRAALGEAK